MRLWSASGEASYGIDRGSKSRYVPPCPRLVGRCVVFDGISAKSDVDDFRRVDMCPHA